MDAELQNKHTEKRKLKKKILEVTGKLRKKVRVRKEQRKGYFNTPNKENK